MKNTGNEIKLPDGPKITVVGCWNYNRMLQKNNLATYSLLFITLNQGGRGGVQYWITNRNLCLLIFFLMGRIYLHVVSVSILTRSSCETSFWILIEPIRIISTCWRYHNFPIARIIYIFELIQVKFLISNPISYTCFFTWACVVKKACDFVVGKNRRCVRASIAIMYLEFGCWCTTFGGVNCPTVLGMGGWSYPCQLSCVTHGDACEDFMKRTRDICVKIYKTK